MTARFFLRQVTGVVALFVATCGVSAGVGHLLVGAFSRSEPGGALPDGWAPLTFPQVDKHTRYTLVRDDEAGVVVRAEANAAASGLMRKIDFPVRDRPLLAWRWKADNLIAKGDVTSREGDDYPVRIYVAFRYSPERLGFGERLKYAAVRFLYGEYPPHAGLNYIWDTKAPEGTLVTNSFVDRVKMIVVESGPARLRQWIGYERDIVADYRRAFGEDPPPISGVALMTDSDNTGESVVAYYGDIALRSQR
ncbi:MAG: DUF3047 domain-containing protein [Casimicrobiaceae bacterium]